MSDLKQRSRWLRSGIVLVSAFVAVPALSASSSVLAGRAAAPADESCWGFNGLNLLNACGTGTATKKYLIPVSVGSTGSFTTKVRARGSGDNNLPWVSCVAKAYSGTGVLISARGTTTGATSTFQTMTLGSVNMGANDGLIFDCDATFGGLITAAFW